MSNNHNPTNDINAVTVAILAAIEKGEIPTSSQLSGEAMIDNTTTFAESNAAYGMHYAGKGNRLIATPYVHRLLLLADKHGVDLGEAGQRLGIATVKGWNGVYLQ